MKILLVDDEIEYAQVMKSIIKKKGHDVTTAQNGKQAISIIKKDKNYDLVLSDLIMGEIDGIGVLNEIKNLNKEIEVILVTGYGTIENAVEAMKKGAFSYFIKGNPIEDLLKEIKKVEELIELRRPKKQNGKFMMTTKNEKFQKIIKLAQKAARTDINVMILGESGVGKDVLANFIHDESQRKDEEFMAVNCCSFSDGLLESELFGHEKGAFTGALDKRKGRFEMANKGTFFLDEVGDVPLDTQVKLLRVLENKVIQRLGSNVSIPTDFRLICATNKDPHKEINKGNLREDFYYRISTITVTIPPLRERKEDIKALVEFFMNKYQVEHNKNICKVEPEVSNFLLNYDYPGNIRELKNIVNRLVALSEDGKILKEDLQLCVSNLNNIKIEIDEDKEEEEIRPLRDIRKEFESDYIEKVLNICNNNVSKTAKELGISRRQLVNKIAEYDIK